MGTSLSRGLAAATALVVATTSVGCEPGAPTTPHHAQGRALAESVVREPGRPPLGVFARDDAEGAVAMVVLGGGPAEEAALLAALLDVRLERSGLASTITLRSDGVEVTSFVSGPPESGRATGALAQALTRPVDPSDAAALVRARERLDALQKRPVDPALALHARCRGEAVPSSNAAPQPTAASLEAIRRAAATTQRVAFGVVGGSRAVEASRAALRSGDSWGSATASPFSLDSPSGTVGARGAGGANGANGPRAAVLTLRVALESRPGARAARAAEALGASESPLARLSAREGGRLVSVTGVAHLGAGCIDLEIAVPLDAPHERVSKLLARAESAARRAEASSSEAWVPSADVGEAARQAALLAMTNAATSAAASVTTSEASAAPSVPERVLRAHMSSSPARSLAAVPAPATALSIRSHAATQGGEAWVLLAAPCAARDESSGDAGLAGVAMAAAASATAQPDGARLAPWITPRGVGILAHGPPRDGESAQAHLARIAALGGSALAAPAPRRALGAARSRALAAASTDSARLLAAVAEAIAPGRLSLLSPAGQVSSLSRASDDALRQRAIALAEGPLRVAVIAPVSGQESARIVSDALAPFALGAAPDGACRTFTPSSTAPARALVELARDTEESSIVLTFVDERGVGLAVLSAIAALVNDGGLAAELGDRGEGVAAEVLPFADSYALVVRFQSRRSGATGARDAVIAARSYLARGAPTDAALARVLRDAEARDREARAGTRTVLATLLADASPASGDPRGSPGAALSPSAVRAAAQALFASGGLAAIAGRAP